MPKKKRSTGLFITLSSVALLIVLAAVLLNTVLLNASTAGQNELHTGPYPDLPEAGSAEAPLPEDLNLIIDFGGRTLPEEAVSPQLAITVAQEVAQRVFGLTFTGRTTVSLPYSYMEVDTLAWEVSAEAGDTLFTCHIDVYTGHDLSADLYPIDEDWSWLWFDSWNEELAEEERLRAEQDYLNRQENGTGNESDFTPEQLDYLYTIKRQAAEEYAAENIDKPHGAYAVDFVNTHSIAGTATATEGIIRMGDADTGSETCFWVEVTLDDGTYLTLRVANTPMEVIGYERTSIPMLDALYGTKE